jgi:hypothetical protein
MNNKKAKDTFDTTVKTVTEKAKTPMGKIVIVIVVLLIVLQTFWNMTESKVVSELQPLTSELANLNARVGEMEKSQAEAIDLDALKADAEAFKTKLQEDIDAIKDAVKADADAIKSAGENFEAKLSALVEAEESKLEALTKETETQKAYVEKLKALETKK